MGAPRGVRLAFALTAVIAFAVPAAAAATSTVSYSPGTGLLVTGDDSADGVIVGISGSDGQDPNNASPPLVYIAFGGQTVAGAGCANGSARPSGFGGQEVAGVKCRLPDPPGPGDANITVNAGAGDDFVGLSNFTIAGVPTLATTNLGAGNDTGNGSNTPDLLRGDDGDDILRGWDGNDRIEGGLGSDTLSPGLGANVVLGQAGDDQLTATQAPQGVTTGSDDFSGGVGSDLVSYAERTAAVTVSPSGPDGQTGENDNIRADVERLQGGQAGDSLTLGKVDPAGSIAGGPGNDILTAASEAPVTLTGDSGADVAQGGPGPNVLNMRDGIGEKISCGGAVDSLDADLKDRAPSDCEKVAQGAVLEGPNVAIRTRRARSDRRGRVALRLRCPAALGSMGCAGTLRLRGARTGRATRYSIRAGRAATVRARLAPADARRARRRSRILSARSVEAGALGDKTTVAPVRVLRARR